MLLLFAAYSARGSEPLRFNNDFLTLDGVAPPVDLNYFAKENTLLPGLHPVLVQVNSQHRGLRTIRFVARDDQVVPCITRAMLEEWGADVSRIQATPDACIDVEAAIPSARVRYVVRTQSLIVTIPQASMVQRAQGAVDRHQWNYGENAAVANYDASVSHDVRNGDTGATLNLDTAVNLGRWLFRNRNYASYDHGELTWQPAEFSLSTPLARFGGTLTAGDTTTMSDLFDSFAFRGVTLQSDDSMVPDSMQGYAPVIRGVATSESRVTVRQNGGVVYDKYVPPGPYTIDDLGAASAGADLDVTVVDASGHVTHYRQPYNTLPIMLRKGLMRYRVAAGEYNGYGSRRRDPFIWAEVERGMTSQLTLFGGLIQAPHYTARSVGAGVDRGRARAISADLVRATAAMTGNVPSTAYRLRYANSITRLGFNLQASLRRYSNAAYLNLDQAMSYTLPFDTDRGVRMEGQLTMNQNIGGAKSLYASYNYRSHFGGAAPDQILQVGLSGAYSIVNYNLSVGNIRQRGRDVSNYVLLTLDLPLGSTANVSYSGNYGRRTGLTQQASVFGSLLRDHRLAYTANASHTRQDTSLYASTTYYGSKGVVSLSQSLTSNSARTVAELKGGVVGDTHGVLLSQRIGETSAIIDAPGLSGALVNGNPGIRTNQDGRAVVTDLMPYRRNQIRLDEDRGQGDDTEATLLQSIATTVPTRGAITRLHFQTSIGWHSLNTLLDEHGKPMPFGTMIRDARHQIVSVVGPLGRVWLTGLHDGENDFDATLDANDGALCRFRITRRDRNRPVTCHRGHTMSASVAP